VTRAGDIPGPARPADDGLLAACEAILGRVTLVKDRSWPHAGNRVVEVADTDGRAWIAKVVGDQRAYARELHAFRHWVPALGGAAPALRAADDRLRLLIMTRLPGRLAEETGAEFDPAVHEQAGRLTRLLHDAEPGTTDAAITTLTVRRLEGWIDRGAHLLTGGDIAYARAQVRPLADIGPVLTVPTHMDNQPRNWIVDESGRVSLIDFGGCKRDFWIRDMRRMYFQQWAGRPDLRDAFYSGYGRRPSKDDLAMLGCYLAYEALSTVIWAREHNDPNFEEHGRRMLAELRSGRSPADG
jgi:hypothetical protein